MNILDYLTTLGFKAAKKRNNDYWYYSPFHSEKTPSFKVNSQLNVWYDHSIGKGGTLLDFATHFHNCSVGTVFKMYPEILTGGAKGSGIIESCNKNNKIAIIDENSIHSYRLLQYIKLRNIPFSIASTFCREVTFKLNDKNYYAIGFKNDLGGFEIRNEFFKSSSSPKGPTTVFNNHNEVAVFEGFFDFLSFMFLFSSHAASSWNFCVLNSLSFFEKSLPYIQSHKLIHLYLDHDKSGRKCNDEALSKGKHFIDESHLYRHYKDLNEWIRTMGKNTKTKIF